MAQRIISIEIQEANDMLLERFAIESIAFVTEKQLCTLLNTSKFTIARWVKKDGLNRYKNDGKIFYKIADVNKLIETFIIPVEHYEHIKIGK